MPPEIVSSVPDFPGRTESMRCIYQSWGVFTKSAPFCFNYLTSLLHNYRGTGGRGQPSASAGAPEPGAAGFRSVPARQSVAECRIPSPVVRPPRTGGRAVPFPGRRRGRPALPSAGGGRQIVSRINR